MNTIIVNTVMRELAIQFNSVTTSLPNIRVLQLIQIEAKLQASLPLLNIISSFVAS